MTLYTERLVLRPWTEADAEDLFRYASDTRVGPIAGWPAHTSVENSREVIATVLSAPETYAVCLREGERAIGAIGLKIGAASSLGIPDTEGEIGYWVAVPFWGRGIMPEATREIIRHAFEDLRLEMLWCGYHDGNERSRRVMEKCGFTYHRTERDVYWALTDTVCTEHVTRLTREDWEQQRMADTTKASMTYQDINAETLDRWVREGWEWGKPVSHEAYEQALRGDWDVYLTPTKPVPHDWFGELRGKRVLGLASGGGQQMPVFTALGAICTVLDYSPSQLESERKVAEREGYDIRIVRADMTKPLPFDDAEFDLVFHPVSNCYVEEVLPIWRECFRVLKPGGTLLAGTDHYVNYIVDTDEERIVNRLPFNPLRNADQMAQLEAEDAGVQFSHSIEEQIGGQLEAGFVLRALYEDTNGEGRLHEMGIPTFLAMRSLKPEK